MGFVLEKGFMVSGAPDREIWRLGIPGFGAPGATELGNFGLIIQALNPKP